MVLVDNAFICIKVVSEVDKNGYQSVANNLDAYSYERISDSDG